MFLKVDAKVPNTLPKKERLHGRTNISKLLADGRHGSVAGIRYLYLNSSPAGHSRMMVSVPKKLFKRAVKRNLLKRRIRESWRKQKHAIAIDGGVDILLMYSTKEIMSYEDVYAGIGQIIDKLNKSR